MGYFTMKITSEGAMYKGAAILGISTLILKIIGLIYKIPLSYILGDEGMGYFNSAYTIYTFFFIVGTAGIPKAISIIVSKSEAENNNTSELVLKYALMFFGATGLILFFIFVFTSSSISCAISNSFAVYSMYAIAPSIPFMCCCGVIRGYLIGKLRFLPIAIGELIAGISKLVFGLIFADIALNLGFDIYFISAFTIFGITVGAFLSFIFMLLASRSKRKSVKKSKLKFKDAISSILKIALPITLSSALGGLSGVIDLSLTMNGLLREGYSQTVATVLYGNYTTLALPMFTLVTTLITPIATALMPTLARSISAADLSGFEINVKNATRMVAFISAPSAIFFLSHPKNILTVIFEEGSATLGYAYLSALAPSILILAPLTLINTALESDGSVILPVTSLSVGMILKLIISSILFSFESVGIFAIIIGTFISYLVPFFISIIFYKWKFRLNLKFMSMFVTPILLASLSALLGAFISKFLHFSNNVRVESCIIIMIMCMFYLLLSLFSSKRQLKNLKNYVNLNKKR